MSCDKSLGDCAPCKDCPPVPNPVMPRCNNYVNDGRFTNATVVVENGCLVAVEQGAPFQYSPDTSCSAGTGAFGRMGMMSAPEPPTPSLAQQAIMQMRKPEATPEGVTVEIGTVHAIGPADMSRVKNSGTAKSVKLDFWLPRETPTGPEERGLTAEMGGWGFDDGRVIGAPTNFPPLTDLMPSPDSPLIVFVTKDEKTGVGTLTIDVTPVVDAAVRQAMVQPMQAIEDLISQVADLKLQVGALQS